MAKLKLHKSIQRKLEKEFLNYGFLPYVYLIYRYEEYEEYEKCQVLYNVVIKANKEYNLNLPTTYDLNSIEVFLNEMKALGHSVHLNKKRLKYYSDILKEIIEP